MLDLKARTMTIPASLAKSGREHCIYFNDLEALLIREQLLARAPGTSLVFPEPGREAVDGEPIPGSRLAASSRRRHKERSRQTKWSRVDL
jgi:hypothetical protein